jgi:hypothetical protein
MLMTWLGMKAVELLRVEQHQQRDKNNQAGDRPAQVDQPQDD